MQRGPRPAPLSIQNEHIQDIRTISASRTASHAIVIRANIVLMAAKGTPTPEIAKRLGCSERTVRKWKARFRQNPTKKALNDAFRSGRPKTIPLEARCELIKLACQRTDDNIAPFHEVWTLRALADALEIVTGVRMSVSEVGRTLRFHQIRPHRVRMWLQSQDPDFTEKANRICELYLNPPPGARVFCVDEKPIQALGRRNPTEVGPDGTIRFEPDYVRNGVCCLLAAFERATGEVFGRVVPRRTADETVEFMEMLAQRYPEGEIYIVWDNLNTHKQGPTKRWTEFNERHSGRFHFVFTPTHASWMNQVEVWFSILERRTLRYGDFECPAEVAWRVHQFIHYWNRHEAHPFRWTWRTDKVKNPRPRKAA